MIADEQLARVAKAIDEWIGDEQSSREIAMAAEEAFWIDLPTVVVNRWRTVGDVEASLRAHRGVEV